jgi:hypothetical protein
MFSLSESVRMSKYTPGQSNKAAEQDPDEARIRSVSDARRGCKHLWYSVGCLSWQLSAVEHDEPFFSVSFRGYRQPKASALRAI